MSQRRSTLSIGNFFKGSFPSVYKVACEKAEAFCGKIRQGRLKYYDEWTELD